jgi:hypothetical protein
MDSLSDADAGESGMGGSDKRFTAFLLLIVTLSAKRCQATLCGQGQRVIHSIIAEKCGQFAALLSAPMPGSTHQQACPLPLAPAGYFLSVKPGPHEFQTSSVIRIRDTTHYQ